MKPTKTARAAARALDSLLIWWGLKVPLCIKWQHLPELGAIHGHEDDPEVLTATIRRLRCANKVFSAFHGTPVWRWRWAHRYLLDTLSLIWNAIVEAKDRKPWLTYQDTSHMDTVLAVIRAHRTSKKRTHGEI